MANGVYWIGQDGKTYVKAQNSNGVVGVSAAHNGLDRRTPVGGTWSIGGGQLTRIEDPVNPGWDRAPAPAPAPTTYNQPAYDPYAAQRAAEERAAAEAEAKRVAERDALRGEISGYTGGINSTFAELFRLIDEQAQSRRDSVGRTYDEQDSQYTSEFEKAMPAIATAFAALGLGNSTFAGDREDTATNEYQGALKKSSANRTSDLADIGRWRQQNVGEYTSQRDNYLASINDAQKSDNVNDLRDARNNIRTGVTNAKGAKGRFGSDGQAVKTLENATNRSAGFSDAFNAYQGVLGSSMDTGTKSAAREAMLQYGDLNEDERDQLTEVQVNNPYQTRVA